MAPQEALQRKLATPARSMVVHRYRSILRARRLKAACPGATRKGSLNGMQHRRHQMAIEQQAPGEQRVATVGGSSTGNGTLLAHQRLPEPALLFSPDERTPVALIPDALLPAATLEKMRPISSRSST